MGDALVRVRHPERRRAHNSEEAIVMVVSEVYRRYNQIHKHTVRQLVSNGDRRGNGEVNAQVKRTEDLIGRRRFYDPSSRGSPIPSALQMQDCSIS